MTGQLSAQWKWHSGRGVGEGQAAGSRAWKRALRWLGVCQGCGEGEASAGRGFTRAQGSVTPWPVISQERLKPTLGLEVPLQCGDRFLHSHLFKDETGGETVLGPCPRWTM